MNTDKIDLIRNLKFGERIAEEETETLHSYFVATESWRMLFENEVDVIYGNKGAGKSALYSILDSKKSDLFDRNILLTTAENPRGNTVFEGLNNDPPTSEIEFIRLWKLYFLIITVSEFDDWGVSNGKFLKIKQVLQEADLIPTQKGLKAILRSCISYVRKLMNIESISPELGLNEVTGNPDSVSLKVSFKEPSKNEEANGIRSVDNLYDALQDALREINFSLWISVDRLDVAFSENIELETNALRALFRVYGDLLKYNNIKLKIFLRDDIWRRITDNGYREASHITRTLTIEWNRETLINLIMKRFLNNSAIIENFGINKAEVLRAFEKQEQLFYRFFPEQIEVGDRKPKSIDWILARVKDGKGIVAPREIIHLFNEGRLEQAKKLQIGQGGDLEGDNIIGRMAFKNALATVSKVRLEQTIYAEYSSLKRYIQALRGEKTDQREETLARIWNIDVDMAKSIARKLVDIGFFEEKGNKSAPRYWVPFLYRNELQMVQGSAE